VAIAHVAQLADDDLHEQLVAGENGAQPFDLLQDLGQLVQNLLPLQAGQALQLHVENRLRLNGAEPEPGDQAFARLGRVAGAADECDDGVEVIERDLEAFEDVRARFRLAQLELGAAPYDLAPELDEIVDKLAERQDARAPGDDGQHDDAEAALQRGVLVEVVENDVGNLSALQLDHDAHAIAVGLVPDVGDPFERLLAHEVGDALDQLRLVDLEGDGADDDRLAIALLRHLDLGLGPHDHGAAPGQVGLLDAGTPDDVTAGGEVGAGHHLEE